MGLRYPRDPFGRQIAFGRVAKGDEALKWHGETAAQRGKVPRGGIEPPTRDFQSAGQVHANRSSRLARVSKTLSQTVAPVNRRENLRPTVSPSTRRAPPAVAHRSRDVGVLASGRITLGSSHAEEAQAHPPVPHGGVLGTARIVPDRADLAPRRRQRLLAHVRSRCLISYCFDLVSTTCARLKSTAIARHR
jgi:hypothetical protein